MDADLDEPLVRQRVVEVSGPGLVGVVLADDGCGLLVGDVDAHAFEAEHFVAAAASRKPGRPFVENSGHPAVVDRGAGHAERQVGPHDEVAVLVHPSVGLQDRGRQTVTLVDTGRSGGGIGGGAQPAARHPILEDDPGRLAHQGVLDHRRVGAVEEDAVRLAVVVGEDFDVVRRGRIAVDAAKPECRGVGDGDERAMHPPAPGNADIDRVVRRDRIEIVAGREPALLELVGPADIAELGRAHGHEHRPLALGSPGAGARDRVHDRGHRVPAGQRVTAARLQPLAVHVGVGVDEARTHRAAAEIDYPRAAAAAGQHLFVGAYRRNASRRSRNGARQPRSVVQRDDLSAVKNQVVFGKHRGLSPSRGASG